MKPLKLILVFLALTLILAIVLLYINRYQVIDYGIRFFAKTALPEYVEIKYFDIDIKKGTCLAKGLKVKNPPGFKTPYLLEADSLTILFDGLSSGSSGKFLIKDIKLTSPVFYIVRTDNGLTNIKRFSETIGKKEISSEVTVSSKISALIISLLFPDIDFNYATKNEIPFRLKEGGIIFDDHYDFEKPYQSSILNLEVEGAFNLRNNYRGLSDIRFLLNGMVNGNNDEYISWDMRYVFEDKGQYKMSNTLNVDNLNLPHFEPYYNKFSPFIFDKALARGKLVFDLDNGNIGSTNELRFYSFVIRKKEEFSNLFLWDVNIDDLYTYFASESGEIVFDFKIKGTLEEPKFYMGSKVKKALTRMAVDKIADIFIKRPEQDASGGVSEPSGLEKIEDVIEIFKKRIAQ
ncbi:MAG: hypothetical protein ABIB11_05415 [Candidatus Omnitrophota bacterium]